MKLSENGLKLLMKWEGLVLHVYKDAAGLPTIGIGHLLTDKELDTGLVYINHEAVRYANGITTDQAITLLAQDVEPAEDCVNFHVSVPLNQNQFDTLVSFAFNCGNGAFKSSTLLKKLNEGDYSAVPAQLMRWTKAGGKQCDGLVTRRQNEVKLWEA